MIVPIVSPKVTMISVSARIIVRTCRLPAPTSRSSANSRARSRGGHRHGVDDRQGAEDDDEAEQDVDGERLLSCGVLELALVLRRVSMTSIAGCRSLELVRPAASVCAGQSPASLLTKTASSKACVTCRSASGRGSTMSPNPRGRVYVAATRSVAGRAVAEPDA